jgi:hypothetical protein
VIGCDTLVPLAAIVPVTVLDSSAMAVLAISAEISAKMAKPLKCVWDMMFSLVGLKGDSKHGPDFENRG